MEIQTTMRRNVEIWQFILGIIGATIACSLWLNSKGVEDGKLKENMELRLQLAEKNISEIKQTQESYNVKQDKLMEAITEVKLILKDKQDRK